MVEKVLLTHEDVEVAVQKLHDRIHGFNKSYGLKIYGIPRGGIPIAYIFKALSNSAIEVVNAPEDAHIFVDDVRDTGNTAQRYTFEHKKPVFTAFDKKDDKRWLVFPWEVRDEHDESATDTVTRMLQRIGEDPTREGLLETPARVLKAYDTWFGGYDQDPEAVLKVFKDGAEGVDEMVLETDIPVYSHCEHHLAPIFGVAHVGYIPNGRVVGLSKLVRLVDIFARRLQVQERLTKQIAETIMKGLEPVGVGVVLQCRHFCMEARGVKSSSVVTTTSALHGALKTEVDARSEFLSLISMTRKGGPL